MLNELKEPAMANVSPVGMGGEGGGGVGQN